jgi:BirA family biotin operon repressor/biotin-[acetyl-CoA-carboxylase] ligase
MAFEKENIIRLATVDSTNRYIRDEASLLWGKYGHRNMVVVATEYQTAGRGQRGNTWNSNVGENLLFSILVRPAEALRVAGQFVLSQAISLAVHVAMRVYGIETKLKWPNDIYVGDRKLAGILVELDCCGDFVEQAVIGIGVNVNQELFPIMDRIPVSMKMLQGRDFVIDDVLATVLEKFEYYYEKLCKGDRDSIAAEYTICYLD